MANERRGVRRIVRFHQLLERVREQHRRDRISFTCGSQCTGIHGRTTAAAARRSPLPRRVWRRSSNCRLTYTSSTSCSTSCSPCRCPQSWMCSTTATRQCTSRSRACAPRCTAYEWRCACFARNTERVCGSHRHKRGRRRPAPPHHAPPAQAARAKRLPRDPRGPALPESACPATRATAHPQPWQTATARR